ncbi:MAG: hypothetical protein E7481_00895 [Ruminococcaceae bacterium]|nr:hypothetical protein [Oscillospiraceae bacterium]
MFSGIKYITITNLGLSQIYLNEKKLLNIEKWFKPNDLSNFSPIPVHDFGNGRLTITDGHSRAFIAHKHGLEKIPVLYDTDDIVTSQIGQLLYKNDIIWCERFNLNDIRDLGSRIITNEEYQTLWIGRCDKSYNLLTQTTAKQRADFNLLHPNLFLFGSNENLDTLFFEDKAGEVFKYLIK